MSYTVLARRYRSKGFDQVVGQEPVTRTLKNAIASGRVAHAYLFTGTRGVGKTSMARILACALNAPTSIPDCPRLPGVEEYPPEEVQQRMAESIMRGDDLNVIEIDGASNRSVEEARQLIANAGLAPTGQAHFKIYIIDEVHMLTREAFNALLKTMEEPPAHVKFILCTTEAHKVPATIQSRCQRFDFRNISTAAIADHLAGVLKQEGVSADKQVVWQVARLGNGSMRDALSLLDRLIAASGGAAEGEGASGTLTGQVLEEILGLPDQDMVVALVDALAGGQVAEALGHTAALLNHGIAQDQLIEVLIEYFRQLMLIGACGRDSELVDLSDEAAVVAAGRAEKFDAAGLVYMIALCENLQRSAKLSANPRAMLDAVVVRLALAEKMADVTALLAGVVAKPTPVIPDTKKKVIAAALPLVTPPPVKSPVLSQEAQGDPGGVWSCLLDAVSDKPAMGWARHLTLRELDGETARVAVMPGQRDIHGFVNTRRREQLAALLKPIIGRPIRVELDSAPVSGDDAPPMPRSGRGAAAGGREQLSQADRARVMELPLVKRVMEVFDATLMDVRREQPDTLESPKSNQADGTDPVPSQKDGE